MSEDADPDCASHESLSKLGVKSSRLNLRARLARSWTGVGTDSKASAEPALYAEVRWQPQDDLSEMLQPLAGVRPWDIRSPEAVSLQGARQLGKFVRPQGLVGSIRGCQPQHVVESPC